MRGSRALLFVLLAADVGAAAERPDTLLIGRIYPTALAPDDVRLRLMDAQLRETIVLD